MQLHVGSQTFNATLLNTCCCCCDEHLLCLNNYHIIWLNMWALLKIVYKHLPTQPVLCLDLWKGAFHMHPIWWTWKTIKSLLKYIWNWNFSQPLSYVGAFCWPNFKSIAFTNLKLQLVKVDVHGRPIFANPVVTC